MLSLYVSRGVLASYEGEEPNPMSVPLAGKPAPMFDQDAVNRILAEERRKHEQKTAAVQRTLEETLASKSLTAAERERLQTELETMQAANRTAKEQAEHERKQLEATYQKKLSAAEAKAKTNEERYVTSLKNAALGEACGSDVFSPAQMKALLGPMTKVISDGEDGYRVVTEFADETGAKREMTPTEAVTAMKGQPGLYGNLFRSGVIAGIGSGNGQGVSQGGAIDVKNLTQQQYMEIRAKNPELLGLRPVKKR